MTGAPAYRRKRGAPSSARQRARHAMDTARIPLETADGIVEINLAESPLGWLATRKGRDGKSLVGAAQLAAGERLRRDFTRAGLTPSVTTNWSPTGGAGGPEALSDLVITAKRKLRAALAAVGSELSGVLLDVCCFLKGLEQVERERGWPARSAKVVLGLALDRLAAHYGLSEQSRGRARGAVRSWHAPAVDDGDTAGDAASACADDEERRGG